jgi:hypothetical protein
VVNFSSGEHKRLIRGDHFVTIGSYAQGYTVVLWTRKMQEEYLDAAGRGVEATIGVRSVSAGPGNTSSVLAVRERQLPGGVLPFIIASVRGQPLERLESWLVAFVRR